MSLRTVLQQTACPCRCAASDGFLWLFYFHVCVCVCCFDCEGQSLSKLHTDPDATTLKRLKNRFLKLNI